MGLKKSLNVNFSDFAKVQSQRASNVAGQEIERTPTIVEFNSILIESDWYSLAGNKHSITKQGRYELNLVDALFHDDSITNYSLSLRYYIEDDQGNFIQALNPIQRKSGNSEFTRTFQVNINFHLDIQDSEHFYVKSFRGTTVSQSSFNYQRLAQDTSNSAQHGEFYQTMIIRRLGNLL